MGPTALLIEPPPPPPFVSAGSIASDTVGTGRDEGIAGNEGIAGMAGTGKDAGGTRPSAQPSVRERLRFGPSSSSSSTAGT